MMSGAALRGLTPEQAHKNAQDFMAKVGVKTPQELMRAPMDQLVKVTTQPGGFAAQPVMDGKTMSEHPFDPAATAMAAGIPLIIGTTEYEITFFPNTKYDPLTDAQLLASFKQTLRTTDDEAARVLAVYKKGRPNASNLDLNLVLASDGFRQGVLTAAERKAAQAAPVYHYYFTWQSPVTGGKLKSFHTVDIPFALANVDNGKSMTGEGKDRYAVEEAMSSAWTNFARTGDPNGKGLKVKWPKFDTTTRPTMIFDNNLRVENDPHGAERLAFASVRRA
jgi:para-nitrobenzyl esterase